MTCIHAEIDFGDVLNEPQMVTFMLLKVDMRAAFERAVSNGKRPSIPEYVNGSIKDLIIRCWANSPDDRPKFSDALDKFIELEPSI